MPGWYDGSVGYHTDDGRIFHNSETGNETTGIKKKLKQKLIQNGVIY